MGINLVEFSGTSRSGKGTITDYLAALDEAIVVEQAGAVYRILAALLHDEGLINERMSASETVESIDRLHPAAVEEFGYLAGSAKLEDRHYAPDISLISTNSSSSEVFSAIAKAIFLKRVENAVNTSGVETVVVDGRNLAPILKSIRGAKLILRYFVTCSVETAAQREASRLKIGLDSPDFLLLFSNFSKIEETDRTKSLEPVKPDFDSINFQKWCGLEGGGTSSLRKLGRYARIQDTQIYIDTSSMAKSEMLNATAEIYRGAVDTF